MTPLPRGAAPSLVPLLLLGCGPTQAPLDIEEMLTYGFVQYDERLDRGLRDLGENLIPWVNAHFEEAEAGYTVGSLTAEHLADVGIERELEAGIVGAVIGIDYDISMDTFAWALAHPNQTEIFPAYLEAERTTEDDLDCFRSRECTWFRAHDVLHTSLVESLGWEAWSEMDVNLRWLTLADGTPVIAHWNFVPDPITLNTDLFEINQQYAFTYSWEREDGQVRRAQAIWVDGQVLVDDVAEDFMLSVGITGIIAAASDLEAWGQAQEAAAE